MNSGRGGGLSWLGRLHQGSGMAMEWVEAGCAQCGETGTRTLLVVPHPDAPQGLSSVVACTGCGLRRLQPRPGPSSIGSYYQQAGGYNAYIGRKRGRRAQWLWDFLRDGPASPRGLTGPRRWLRPLTRPLARWLFDINVELDGRSDVRVLEVGSGFGDILIYLRSRGCRVLGTDLSDAA